MVYQQSLIVIVHAHYTCMHQCSLCKVYFYFLISHAVWAMHQSVLHLKHFGSAGMLRKDMDYFIGKKSMNYGREYWPAENLTLRNDCDSSVRLPYFPQK